MHLPRPQGQENKQERKIYVPIIAHNTIYCVQRYIKYIDYTRLPLQPKLPLPPQGGGFAIQLACMKPETRATLAKNMVNHYSNSIILIRYSLARAHTAGKYPRAARHLRIARQCIPTARNSPTRCGWHNSNASHASSATGFSYRLCRLLSPLSAARARCARPHNPPPPYCLSPPAPNDFAIYQPVKIHIRQNTRFLFVTFGQNTGFLFACFGQKSDI